VITKLLCAALLERASSEDELLTVSNGAAIINGWNRLAIGFRLQHPANRRRTV
jgi:alkylhydroperoxidase family enzyme